jgi:hypothetical protein
MSAAVARILGTTFTGVHSQAVVDPDAVNCIHRQSLFERLPRRKNAVFFLGDSLTQNCAWHEFLRARSIAESVAIPAQACSNLFRE